MDRNELADLLESFSRAYPEEIFPPLTEDERKALPRGIIDRCSGAMGRHFAKFAAQAAAALRESEEWRRDAEKWADVAGYSGSYQVSSLGRVRSVERVDSDGNRRRGQHMIPYRKANGYVAVTLWSCGKGKERYVHRLVAAAFIDNPNDLPQVNHKDGDTANNAVENLEWVTNAENQTHARRVLAKGVRAVCGISEASGEEVYFPSLQHAVEAGFVRANIQKCIAGTRNVHRGYKWYDAAIYSARGAIDAARKEGV